MTDQTRLRINPGLIAALEHYANGAFDPDAPSVFVYEDANHRKHHWSVERTCAIALEIVGNEEISYLKLKLITARITELRLDNFFQQLKKAEVI